MQYYEILIRIKNEIFITIHPSGNYLIKNKDLYNIGYITNKKHVEDTHKQRIVKIY